MIVGDTFVWAHIGKTGGDATRQLFLCVPELIRENFGAEAINPKTGVGYKHDTFAIRGITGDKTLVLNIRSLPAFIVSRAWHEVRHHPEASKDYPCPVTAWIYKNCKFPPGDVLCVADWGDSEINRYTDDQRYNIDFWLRMEYLREDFISFINTIRPVTDFEVHKIRTCRTKESAAYDHDLSKYFTEEQVKILQKRNPIWSHLEKRLYGSLVNIGE